MPIASTKQKQQARNTNTTSSKKLGWQKIALIIVLGSGLILAAISMAAFFMFGDDKGGAMHNEGTRMEEYLNDKYGQEFVVENVRETGTGFAVKGSWRGDAYPKSDPSLKFEVRRSQTTDKIDYETFLQVLWTKQGSAEVEDFLSREVPNNEGYILKIEPGGSLYDSIQGETPNLSDVLEDRRNLIAYSLSVRNAVNISAEEPSETQLENAFKVVSFVKAKDISPASYAYYNYRDTSFSDKDDAGQQKYQYGIHIERDELDNISTARDLITYFKTLQ